MEPKYGYNILASADDLRSLPGTGFYVESDAGGRFEVLTHHQRDHGGGWKLPTEGHAVSRHGLLVRFQQSGYAVKQGVVRCRITASVDPGGPNDLILFTGEEFGGVMPSAITTTR